MEVIYPKKFDLSSCTSSIDQVSDVLNKINQIPQLLENHTVTLLGEYTWNGFTTNIYFLSGGVPPSTTIGQYLTEVCGVSLAGAVFISLDSETGLKAISLYPVEYLQKLIANNAVFTIGGEKYVVVTRCELEVNNNELGSQIGSDTDTELPTSIDHSDVPLLYNWFVGQNPNISSRDDFYVPSEAQCQSLIDYLSANGYNGRESVALRTSEEGHWDTDVGDDAFGFNAFGDGVRRDGDGHFLDQGKRGGCWTSDGNESYGKLMAIYDSALSNIMNIDWDGSTCGRPLRLVKDAVGRQDGEIIDYIGNNGVRYTAIVINELYWLTSSLQETMWRDGSFILTETENLVWGALDVAAVCSYLNVEFESVSTGGVSVVDGDELVSFDYSLAEGLNNPKVVSELSRRKIAPVLLRRL